MHSDKSEILEETDRAVSPINPIRRKKLWQIESSYHCSIIGACLSRKDLKRIALKKTFGFEADDDAFTVHRHLSALASSRLPKTRALHKVLDQKFKIYVKRYSNLVSDKGIYDQWLEDLSSGENIAGSYWAIMTHPSSSDELLDKVYGDCHMISYDVFSKLSRDASKQRELQRKIDSLTVTFEKSRKSFSREKEMMCSELNAFQLKQKDYDRLDRQYKVLEKENQQLRELVNAECLAEKTNQQKEFLAILKTENHNLRVAVKNANNKALDTSKLLQISEKALSVLREDAEHFRVERLELQEEITSLEQMFKVGMEATVDCGTCDEKSQNSCRGIGLSGKTVLYVGGRANMISHYRQMVEKYGGICLHHDGGKERSRNLLPRMLSGADVVLCPIDCVSHDACKCVKKMCKRSCKPFVMMHSSGLSSLAKGLETFS